MTIQSDTNSFLKMTSCGMPQIPAGANTELEHPITMDELRTDVKKGKAVSHRAPTASVMNTINTCGTAAKKTSWTF